MSFLLLAALQVASMTMPDPAARSAPAPPAPERQPLEPGGPAAAQRQALAALAGLEAGDGRLARDAADRALAQPLPAAAVAELRMIRARADALLNDLAAARADLDLAIAAQPTDIVPRLLSATLARRSGDIERARADVEAAWDLAPDEPLVLLESARLALALGGPEQASVAWRRVLAGSGDEASKAEARDGLRSLGLKVE